MVTLLLTYNNSRPSPIADIYIKIGIIHEELFEVLMEDIR